MRSKVARFYSWSYFEIENIPYVEFLTFYKAIDNIEAQEMLMNMQISDYPQMNTNGRNKLHRKISNMARPDDFEERTVSSFEMAKILGANL